jgi:hypothetical protein
MTVASDWSIASRTPAVSLKSSFPAVAAPGTSRPDRLSAVTSWPALRGFGDNA